MRKVWLVMALLGAVACGGEKTPAAAAVGDAAADSSADSGADAAPADAATDATADSSPDASQDVAESPYAVRCSAIAGKVAAAMAACGCKDQAQLQGLATTACLDLIKGSLEEPAAAGELVLDPAMDATCTQSLSGFGNGCAEVALDQAYANCALAWFDTAQIGELCHAAGPLVCGGGQGLCVVVQPPDGFKCFAAGSQGDACSATQPCRVGLACLEGTLTRAKTCGVPGSTCNLSDKCRQGFKCESGACKADASVTTKAICKP